MLTKSDLQEIQKIVKSEVQTETKKVVSELTRTIVREELVPVRRDLKKLSKTVDVVAKLLDEADVDLRKRVKKIETHLGLPN